MSKNDKFRGKESGESIEIILFGKKLNNLTVKESLYVLNIDNYSLNLENFRNNFQKYEDKAIKELLNKIDNNPLEISYQDSNKMVIWIQ